MLSGRCAYLVCDAPEPHRCEVDELLVVTFTDAAAAEMRERIAKAIRARAATVPGDERLARQVHLIDQAAISTLHGFCSRLLRQHFHLVGLDPAFTVMDAEEAKLLRLEVGRELMQDRYELDDDAASFQRLVDGYAEGDDERLLRHVLRTREMLTSVVDPAAWLARARERIVAPAAGGPLLASELGQELVDLLGTRLSALRERCAGALELCRTLGHFPGYVQDLSQLLDAVRHFETVLIQEGPDTLAREMESLELPRLPPVSSDTPHKDVAKAAVDAVRKEVKSGGWRDALRFTEQQWQDGMRLVAPHAHTFLGLVEQFEVRYARAKDAARQLDFADLERFALQVLRDPRRDGLWPTPTARAYHRAFKHVLVDEYQDINEVQDAILSLLSHECLLERAEGSRRRAEAERGDASSGPSSASSAPDPQSAVGNRQSAIPNLFCVGDVKQSIYRFRLAEPERFLQREHAFRSHGADGHGRVIDLQANFRSRAALLGAINGVFERLMTREAADILYDATHRLVPGLTYPDPAGRPAFAGAPIEMHLLPAKFGTSPAGDDDGGDAADPAPGAGVDDSDLDRSEREAVLIARRIHELMGHGDAPRAQVLDKDRGAYRPIRYRDVVVLLRSMKFKADQYADVLRLSGIPVHAESGTGYFESVEVRDVLSLLAVLDNQRQDVPLAALLRGPFGGLADAEDCLARVRLAYPSRERPVPFHAAVVRYAAEQSDELSAKLRDVLATVHRWRELAHRRPLADAIWAIFEEAGYLAYVAGLPGGDQRVANLMYLHERATQFGAFQRQGLSRFLEFLDNLRAESDLGQPSVSSEAEDVVRIMSVHRSKGLEFPVVVLPDLGKSINLSDCQGPIVVDREAGLGMATVDEARRARYPSLASTLVQERLRRQAVAEELRVLYVAMTRAREHLILVGTAAEESPERWRGRWSDHRGPLPADAVQSAGCALDWLGPVAACPPGAGGEVVRLVAHGSAEVARWEAPARKRQERDEMQERLAKLEPLDPPPPPDPAADAVIERLTFAYPFTAYARQPAVRSVTAAAKLPSNSAEAGRSTTGLGPQAAVPDSGSAAAAEANPAPPQPASQTSAASLALPRFLGHAGMVSAADVGTATHLVLQHLDLARPLDAADVEAQVAGMVDRRLMDAAQAAAVDRGAIEWFVGTDVGRLMRGRPERVRRELPVYYAVPAVEGVALAADPMDRVMVRGRLDALVDAPDGLTLVDFKTDAVAAEAIPTRAARYRPQVEEYRTAIARATGRTVTRAYLVFLSARVIVEMASNERDVGT